MPARPASAAPNPARPRSIVVRNNQAPAGGMVIPAGGTVMLQDQFAQLEQELDSPPPAARIGQTPADPQTRPPQYTPSTVPQDPRSVVSQQGSQRGPALMAPDDELVPLPGDSHPLRGQQLPASPASTRLASPRQDETTAAQERERRRPQDPDRRSADKDCEEFRQKLLNDPIQRIALDISPPRNPRGEALRPEAREWHDLHGNPICFGALTDLRRGYAIVETAEGSRRLPVSNLSESDLMAIGQIWQIPGSCIVSTGMFAGRCWEPQTATWHASNLCHKPLYFEEVALERYGHSDGPIMQPLRSSGHFLISLLSLPYQTGIHPPNECIYALGYYRPGNCAPWLVYPVPISREGAVRQAGVMLTGAYTIF